MRVLALPRDANPYQELLYREMRREGVPVGYLADATPSRTLNLLLLPLELVWARLRGGAVVHLHWVFGFGLPGGRRTRWLARRWYGLFLRLVGLLRLPLVWTAHNALPHDPVFADDLAARRALVRRAALVVAHDEAALGRLAELGLAPRRSVVIPHGSYPAPPVPPPPAGPGRTFLFLGRVTPYKGVPELLAAFAPLEGGHRLVVAGSCPDAALAARLRGAASAGVELDLRHVPEEELAGLFAAADAVVLPFRAITTSGSALLALSHGRPLVLPDLPALAGLPGTVRYDGSVPGLARALADVAALDAAALRGLSDRALAYAASVSWPVIAAETTAAFRALRAGRAVHGGTT
ncbi:glycosyltransferase [Actinocorallia sp. API 0066]|uniref:glycosyltransferase n=1 Tax=Actinocorallia sp. API 0066 TaxID=2896846 RepID=UPI001E4B033D|nr:glycosyltransferase [Actinocorallia sp. API 0066]MCD0450135.1 glycosyltransferase [Actinocorallia sp. API 0066]